MLTGKPLVSMELHKPPEPHDHQCRIARSVGQGALVERRRCAPLGLAWSEHGATLMSVGGATALHQVQLGGRVDRHLKRKLVTPEARAPLRTHSGRQ